MVTTKVICFTAQRRWRRSRSASRHHLLTVLLRKKNKATLLRSKSRTTMYAAGGFPKSRRFVKHRFLILLLATLLLTQWSLAQTQSAPQSQNSSSSATGSHAAQQSKPNCTDNGTYVNSKGQTVKRPENCSAAPQGATAQCRDGTYSFSRSRRVAWSHHGGVDPLVCNACKNECPG